VSIVEDRREAVRQAAGQYYRLRIWHHRRRGLDPETAVKVVQEGVRALSTGALPDLPTAAWLKAVDDSARLDIYRRQGRARAAAGAMAAWTISNERPDLPAKRAG
jgi:hypothetical protein